MTSTVRVASIQMTCQLGAKAANMARAEHLLADLAGQADVACLPELFNTGYHLDALGRSLFDLAELVPATPEQPAGPAVARLRELAAHLDLAIVAGLAERDSQATGLLYDSVILIDRRGDVLPIFELDGLRVGLAICFKAAFPPIFSTLALHGAQVIFNPSAVPVGYGHLQDVRTRARAQDNQCFVVAINHVGAEEDVVYCGRSQIADPRGEVQAIFQDPYAVYNPFYRVKHVFDEVIRNFNIARNKQSGKAAAPLSDRRPSARGGLLSVRPGRICIRDGT